MLVQRPKIGASEVVIEEKTLNLFIIKWGNANHRQDHNLNSQYFVLGRASKVGPRWWLSPENRPEVEIV